mgnify:CR=1 FL=1
MWEAVFVNFIVNCSELESLFSESGTRLENCFVKARNAFFGIVDLRPYFCSRSEKQTAKQIEQ